MRVAITSTGNSLESDIDSSFGRCAYFVVYDTETQGIEIFPNPNRNLEEGAGPASVQLMVSRNVSKIISGDFGMKIKSLLDRLKIQQIVAREPKRKILEIIELLNHH